MLTRADLAMIAEQVKENHARLNSCARHEFVAMQPVQRLNQRYSCKHCGGEIDAHAHFWFECGRAMA